VGGSLQPADTPGPPKDAETYGKNVFIILTTKSADLTSQRNVCFCFKIVDI
jgi:hypothetical protein